MDSKAEGRVRRVVVAASLKNGYGNPAMSFVISGREVGMLRELKMRYYEGTLMHTTVGHGEMLRRIIDAVFKNLAIDFPIVVYKRTYDLYTTPQGDWYKVLVDKVLRDQIMSLSNVAYAGLSRLYPRAFKKPEFAFDPRLGVDFALVAFEYFLDTDWKDAVYVIKPR